MAARDPKRDKAFALFNGSKGKITNREIAAQLDINEKKVSVWKLRDKWVEQTGFCSTTKKSSITKENKCSTTKKNNRSTTEEIAEKVIKNIGIENEELTDKQRMFCIFYCKNHNATQAAINAGYSPEWARTEGSRLLANDNIRAEINRIKDEMCKEALIRPIEILREYEKMAFADISDYVSFGQKEVPVMSAFGPVTTEDGETLMKTVNYVDLKESSGVDGSLISEVKQGKEGVSVKLHDKKWALEKLEKYLDVIPDKFSREMQREKIELEKKKIAVFEKREAANKLTDDITININLEDE